MKKIILSSLVAITLFTSGCLKDKDYEDQRYGTQESTIKGVGFKNPTFNLALTADATPQPINAVIVGVNSSQRPSSDVSYTVTSTPGLVPAGVTALPAGAFTFESAGVVKAGEYFDTLQISIINASLLDPNLTYGIGLTITSTSPGYVVIGNGNTAVITFNVKNKYDGVYNVTGTFQDVTSALFTGRYPFEYELVTAGPSTVEVKMVVNGELVPARLFSNNGAGSFYGNFGLEMTFDPSTDKISDLRNFYGDPANGAANGVGNPQLGTGAPLYAATNTRRATLDPSGVNAYEPGATPVIRIKYFMLQPNVVAVGPRVFFNETWTYVRPRD